MFEHGLTQERITEIREIETKIIETRIDPQTVKRFTNQEAIHFFCHVYMFGNWFTCDPDDYDPIEKEFSKVFSRITGQDWSPILLHAALELFSDMDMNQVLDYFNQLWSQNPKVAEQISQIRASTRPE